MTTLEQAARQALEALEAHADIGIKADKQIAALRQALEPKPCNMGQICLDCQPRGANGECPDQQPKQEPMAHLWECIGRWSAYLVTNGEQAELSPPDWLIDAVKAATAPPKRDWSNLSDGVMCDIAIDHGLMSIDWIKFARAIEAKLKEKNA